MHDYVVGNGYIILNGGKTQSTCTGSENYELCNFTPANDQSFHLVIVVSNVVVC